MYHRLVIRITVLIYPRPFPFVLKEYLFCFVLHLILSSFLFFISSLLTSSSSSLSETQLVLSVNERVVFSGEMEGQMHPQHLTQCLAHALYPVYVPWDKCRCLSLRSVQRVYRRPVPGVSVTRAASPGGRAGTIDRQREMILQLLRLAWKCKAGSPCDWLLCSVA